MRAWRLAGQGLDTLQLVDLAPPRPKRGQVRVRVHACALNHRDLMVVTGPYPHKDQVVPLSDGAGEVVEVGEDVTRVAVGDRVIGAFFQNFPGGEAPPELLALGGQLDGMLAEEVVLEETGVVKVPAHLSFEQAATLPCAAVTAWSALVDHGHLAAGETVLVQGTGGVSLFALQLARAMGARGIVTSSSDAKLERARALGATGTVNYLTTPEWHEAAKALTSGRGVDHVVEVGGKGTFVRSLAAIRPGGRVSVIGGLTGPGEAQVNPRVFLLERASVQGIYVGSTQTTEALCRAVEATGLKPVIDAVVDFDAAPEAWHALEAGPFGKVVIRL